MRKIVMKTPNIKKLGSPEFLSHPFLITSKMFPVCIYLFKVNNGHTKTICKICSKLTIQTPERCHWSHCLPSTDFTQISGVSIVDFEQANVGFVMKPSKTLSYYFWSSAKFHWNFLDPALFTAKEIMEV